MAAPEAEAIYEARSIIRRNTGVISSAVSEVRHLLDGNDTLTDAYVRERFVRGGEEVHTELIGIPKTED